MCFQMKGISTNAHVSVELIYIYSKHPALGGKYRLTHVLGSMFKPCLLVVLFNPTIA